jgi:Tol biopolymer transport system component
MLPVGISGAGVTWFESFGLESPGVTLGPGQTVLHYEVVDKLGAGGMGVVWRAIDTTLDREIAIKVLPEAIGNDPESLARFEREAKLLASLNHQNIAEIHGLHTVGETRFIAMELIAGEDLSARIARGPLPEREVLEIARQVARALESAHEQGVIHRDLKPANIQVMPDGRVKVLDFGLAKAFVPETTSDQASPSMSPTLTSMGTRAGLILGTAAYMAPEQARGQAADKRADIWSLGCVLFEALTGRAAFSGDTISDTLAEVLKSEPDWEELPESTDPTLRLLIGRCLEKDVRQRVRDVGEVRIAVKRILGGSASDSIAVGGTFVGPAIESQESRTGSDGWGWKVVALLMVLAAVLAGLGSWFLRPASDTGEPIVRRFEIVIPELQGGFVRKPWLSPDGRRFAYVAADRIWIRELDQLEPRELPDSEGARSLAWSPDGEEIAWQADGKIWRADIADGARRAVCIAPRRTFWIAWGRDDRLLLTPDEGPLWEVSARGGDPVQHLAPDESAEVDFHSAAFLPDGDGLIFSLHRKGQSEPDTIQVHAAGQRKTLLQVEGQSLVQPQISETGHLIYQRLGENAGLWAASFSLERLEMTGTPVLIDREGVYPSVSRDGSLLYSRTSALAERQLVWVDREGRVTGTIGEPQDQIRWPSLSPDGSKVAVTAERNGVEDIWIYDTQRGSRFRLTFESEHNWAPAWYPESDRLLFGRSYSSDSRLISMRDDGSGETIEIATGELADVSPEGRVVFERSSEDSGDDLFHTGRDGAGDPVVFLDSPSGEEHAQISPNGDYLAYQSSQSGREDLYLKRFPSGEGRWQVSIEGGDWPRWSQATSELFFLRDGVLMGVDVELGDSPTIGTPRELFSLLEMGLHLGPRPFDVSPDGQRFVMIRPLAEPRDPALTFVENWAFGLN